MRKRLSILCLFTLLTLLSAGCAQGSNGAQVVDAWEVITVTQQRPLQIGVAIAPLTILGTEGQEYLRGMELAVQRRPSIKGFPVEVLTVDAGCSAEGGQFSAEVLVNALNLAVVIGPVCTEACQAGAPIYEQAYFTAVSPACSATALTDELLHVGAFMRTMYDDALEADVAARFAYTQLGARRAALIHDGTPETADLIAAFEASFTRQGGQIVSSVVIPRDEENVRPLLAELAPGRPDLIYAPLLPAPAARVALQLNTTLLAGTPLIGGRHLISTWFVQEVGLTANGTYAVGPYVQGEAYDNLVQAYNERYGEQPSSVLFAFAYDATTLALQAIENVAVTNGQSLRIGRQALRQNLYNTSNWPGVTGVLTCTQWGDCSVGALAVQQVRDNEWQIVYIP